MHPNAGVLERVPLNRTKRDSIGLPVSERICKEGGEVVPGNQRSSSPFLDSVGEDQSPPAMKSYYFERSRDSICADALHARISDLKLRERSPLEDRWVYSPALRSPRSSVKLAEERRTLGGIL